jgi:hypothetical protein
LGRYLLDRRLILPRPADNEYRGRAFAKYAFYALAAITIVRSLIHMFARDGGAQSIATIPLGDFSPRNAADTVVLLFALWGLSQLIMGVFYAIVSLRYRSLIPLMYIFIFFEYAMRIVLGHLKPISLAGAAPGEIGNWVLAPAAAVLFLLSILRPKKEIARREDWL